MKQTAVEWLVSKIDIMLPSYLIDQAKEMEKQQTEISDEEIAEIAEEFELTNGIYGFKQGVKWYKEQLKNKL